MRSAKDFFRPLAVGAPEPVREIPFRPSRMIHFFDPSNEKMAAKVPEMAKKSDVMLGNLEDAIQADNKIAAREGLIKIANEVDFGTAQLWALVFSTVACFVLQEASARLTVVSGRSLGESTSRLYSLNSLGAATGAVAAGFALLPLVGVTGTTWSAGSSRRSRASSSRSARRKKLTCP